MDGTITGFAAAVAEAGDSRAWGLYLSSSINLIQCCAPNHHYITCDFNSEQESVEEEEG
jgi:hypothetical protein